MLLCSMGFEVITAVVTNTCLLVRKANIALLAACFMLISYLVYSSNLKTEAACS
jgi:hypothetical protein